MKIAIIGITGQVGALIAQEARNRGAEVLQISINEEKQANSIPVLAEDAFYLTAKDVSGIDVVVNAFEQTNPDLSLQYQILMQTLICVLEQQPTVRLVVVGEADSLFVDETKKNRVGDSALGDTRIRDSRIRALDRLKNSTIRWSYFSPAQKFDLSGPRTGKYELGADVVFYNSDKENYISGKDYAIALLDEIEEKRFEKCRFTAVSEKDPSKAADIKMFQDKMIEYPGASQWRSPLCFELSGKSFHLVMDDGTEGTLWFMTGETLYWAEAGSEGRSDLYECVKSEENIYLVNMEIADAKPRTGLTIVLDLEQSLVTAVFTYQGNHKKYPDMLENKFVFGAIKEPGKPLPRKRHGYTTEMAGTRIRWRYTTQRFSIIHVYAFPQYMRLHFPGLDETTPEGRDFLENPYDEPTAFIKVKDNLYLVSCLEQHNTERGGIGNNMLFLIDTERLHDVGRSFGLDRSLKPENYIFSAIGELVDADSTDQVQSKYRV